MASIISRLESGPLKRYLGVQGGILLRGPTAQRLSTQYPLFGRLNNALLLAPTFKWGLAIVPLIGVITGSPPVERLDVNNSAALAATGAIWAYYSTLVTPRANALFAVSIALVGANGFNLFRRYRYDQEQKQKPLTQNNATSSNK